MTRPTVARVLQGAARADTILESSALTPGTQAQGKINLYGGTEAATIDNITLSLLTYYRHDGLIEPCVLGTHAVAQNIMLEPGATSTVLFSLPVPACTPLSLGDQRVYLRTVLHSTSRIHPGDMDLIHITPHPLMSRVFEGLEQLGFQTSTINCVASQTWWWSQPFMQVFTLLPGGRYQRSLQALELTFDLGVNGMDVWLKLMRNAPTSARRTPAPVDVHCRVSEADLKRRDWAGFLADLIERQGQEKNITKGTGKIPAANGNFLNC
jgi:sporulation-control protein